MTSSNPRHSLSRVLLIEDSVPLAYALTRRLEEEGMAVDHAVNGFDGIQRLIEQPYHAVVLDLVTPGPMNGFAVITYLEGEQPELLDRLFIISGMPEQTIINTAPRLVPRYYRKPFDERDMVAAVREVIAAGGSLRRGERILVADDDADSRLIVTTIARRLGRDIVEAGDGHEAIRRLASETFAGIVVDLVMPRVDGFGVIAYLREQTPQMLKRTVVLTGVPGRFRAPVPLEGVCSLLEKPATPEQLQRVLRHCIEPAA